MSKRDRRLDTDSDFILSNKYGNSLKKLLSENPNGVSDTTICRALDLTHAELQSIYESVIMKLRLEIEDEIPQKDE